MGKRWNIETLAAVLVPAAVFLAMILLSAVLWDVHAPGEGSGQARTENGTAHYQETEKETGDGRAKVNPVLVFE